MDRGPLGVISFDRASEKGHTSMLTARGFGSYPIDEHSPNGKRDL